MAAIGNALSLGPQSSASAFLREGKEELFFTVLRANNTNPLCIGFGVNFTNPNVGLGRTFSRSSINFTCVPVSLLFLHCTTVSYLNDA